MALKSCHHHGFTVFDVDRSLKFYRDLLGLEVVRISERSDLPAYDRILGFERVKFRVALLRHPVHAFILELIQYVNPPVLTRELRNDFVGSSHVAFEVDDIDAMFRAMQAAGYGAINPPEDVIRNGQRVARAMYALDPDGITVEMFQEFADVMAN
ncbi:MAG: VOC family protein [Planctomycetota bacterium]|nr:VOC family protein [Planctomycetota bacterium]MDA1180715.1 VOC family protein [Planctomycetota bacterium]